MSETKTENKTKTRKPSEMVLIGETVPLAFTSFEDVDVKRRPHLDCIQAIPGGHVMPRFDVTMCFLDLPIPGTSHVFFDFIIMLLTKMNQANL